MKVKAVITALAVAAIAAQHILRFFSGQLAVPSNVHRWKGADAQVGIEIPMDPFMLLASLVRARCGGQGGEPSTPREWENAIFCGSAVSDWRGGAEPVSLAADIRTKPARNCEIYHQFTTLGVSDTGATM